MVSVSLYALIFYDTRLYAEIGLQGFYFVLAIYGWWSWQHGTEENGELRVTLTTNTRRVALLSVATFSGLLLGQTLSHYTSASLPFLDSMLASFSITTQWMQTRKLLESWLVWLILDVFYISMFLYKKLYLTAGMYTVFLVLAAIGYANWKRSMQDSQSFTSELTA